MPHHAMPHQAIPCHAITGHSSSHFTVLHYAVPDYTTLFHTMPSQTALHHTVPCHTRPYYAMPCYVLLNKLQKVAPGLSLLILGALSVFPSVHPGFVPFGWVNLCELHSWLLKLAPCSVPLDLVPLSSPGLQSFYLPPHQDWENYYL